MNLIISQFHRFLTKGNTDIGYSEKFCEYLCYQYPEYRFFYLSYINQKNGALLPSNAQKVTVSKPAIINPVSTWWFRRQLKKIIRQLKIDTVIHIDNYLPVAEVKEWILLTETPRETSEFPGSLTGIITPSLAIKVALIKKNIAAQHIKIIRCLPNSFYTPTDWDTKENLKQKFADGREYLLFDATNASHTHILNVMKGFSTIKKWLKTSIKLIIINASINKNLTELLNTYKYKNDVIVSDFVDFIHHDLLAAAFGFIYVPQIQKDELPLLQAMQCGVPAITCKSDFFEEICNEAVVYVDPGNEEDIGEKFMKLCKDEKTRAQLVQKAASQVELISKSNDLAVF